MMPAGGAALRSTMTTATTRTERDENQRSESTSSSAYVFAPNWMLPSGKKSSTKNLAFTSFAGGDGVTPLPSSRKIDHHHHHHYPLSKPRSSSSSPYPGRAQQHQQQQQPLIKTSNAERSRRLRPARTEEYRPEEDTLTKDDFPTLTADDIVKQQDNIIKSTRSSAWSNPHMIKEKVLSPSFEEVGELEAPSPEDLEFERLKALVPKQRQHTNAVSNRKLGSRSSASSSHQQHIRNKPILRSHNHNAKRETVATAAATTAMMSTMTPTVAAAAAAAAAAVVKLPVLPNSSLSSSLNSNLSSSNKRISSSSSSMSSSSAGMNETSLLYNDDVSSQTSNNCDLPRTPVLVNQEVAEKRAVSPICVDEHEKEHFLSWFCTWTGRPGLEWKDDSMSTDGLGEYSYFGPLGTKSGPSVLLHHESILVHPSWPS